MEHMKPQPLQALRGPSQMERESLTEAEGLPSGISSFLHFKAICVEFFSFLFNRVHGPSLFLLILACE